MFIFQTKQKSVYLPNQTHPYQTELNHTKPNSSKPNQTKPDNSQPKLAGYAWQNHIQLWLITCYSVHSCHFRKSWVSKLLTFVFQGLEERSSASPKQKKQYFPLAWQASCSFLVAGRSTTRMMLPAASIATRKDFSIMMRFLKSCSYNRHFVLP